tara:strand:- start:5839 stop:8319 length:2481 start_codon:yes stop_codon:yes gene_type:complete
MRSVVEGQVLDAQGLALPGAVVTMRMDGNTLTVSVVSDQEGRFAQYGLQPGIYNISAALSGFSEFASDAFEVRLGERVSLTIELQLAQVTEQVTVTPDRSARRTDYSNPSNVVSSDQIESLITPTVEDVVNYQPSMVVRRRFIGDSNGTIGMRGANMFQTARSMVYADGVPLHNPLRTRWNGAPRWSLVAPEEIESAEIIYGPFSAEYSGNSMGGVVKLNTRLPDRAELQVTGNMFSQGYSANGMADRYNGNRLSTSYGDRIGQLQFHVLHNHLTNVGHPQSYARDDRLRARNNEVVTSGVFDGLTETGASSITYGDDGPQRVRSDLLKTKIRYTHTPTWSQTWIVAYEDREWEGGRFAKSYVRDTAGNTIWGDGRNDTKDASFGNKAFNVRNDLFGINDRLRRSLFGSWEIDGEFANNWALEVVASSFTILEDFSAESNFNPADPLDDGTGAITRFGNSGWRTFDAKLSDPDFVGADVSLVTGVSYSAQQIVLDQYSSTDYRSRIQSIQSGSAGGKTSLAGVFGQLGLRVREDLEITLGGRQEFWSSTGGYVLRRGKSTQHPERTRAAFSPKASLGWEPADRVRLQYSIAKASRFPLPEELYDNEIRTYGTVLGDARLEAEEGLHQNISVQRGFGDGHIEANYFRDDVANTIFTQFQFVGGTGVYSFLPVDRVVTDGIEVVFNQRRLIESRFDMQASMTFLNSRIGEHVSKPAWVGNQFPRMPKFRMTVFGIYNVTSAWQASVGLRHSGNQFGDLDNGDFVHNVFGSMDAFNFLEAKLSYLLPTGSRFSFGVSNLANEVAFVHHPWPQRTFFAEVSVDVLADLIK